MTARQGAKDQAMTEVREAGLGPRVRHYRRRAGMTQEELAERAALSVRALAYLERGERHPYPGTLARLADALELSPAERDELLHASEEETEGPTRAPTSVLPSTLQAFLLADIRGYTRFTEEHGDEAAARLTVQFVELVEEVVSSWEGRIVETRGDEVLLAFASPRAALQAAVALQAQFGALRNVDPAFPVEVGMGLDAGEAVPVEEGYRGGALNLAARLCALAAGGEVFASEGVVHLARTIEGLVFVDRGEVEIRGLSRPVRVMQIGRAGVLPPELPPVQPMALTHPTNLPDEPTPFIGRSHEVAAIVDIFQQPTVRLVVLTGTGGTGKTRLALQVGGRLVSHFPDGVFFVSLAALSDPALVPSAIAAIVGVQEEGGIDLLTTLVESLQRKQILLILDNYEHLLPAVSVVSSLLDACRKLHILVTSRTPLHLMREHEYPVSPLALPDPDQLFVPKRLLQCDAVALFIDRARAVRPDFSLKGENARAVGELCVRLDGLPLAIVLAASRLRMFSPQALLQRLSNRLEVLTGGALDLPERQRTLRATLDWSYSLLSEEEQRLLTRLSIFAGGCTLEAAETVCNPEGGLDVAGGLGSLVEQSLVRQEGKEEPRFSMLETIREYASKNLERRGELERLRARHIDYHLELAETADNRWCMTQQRTWLDRLESERDNLDTAMQWAIANRDFDRAARLTVALHAYRCTRAHWTAHEMWLETLLQQDISPSTAAWGRLLRCAGSMAILRGEYERAAPLLHRSLELLRDREDRPGIAASLRQQAILAVYQGRFDDAVTLLNESLGIARASKDKHAVAECLDNLGGVMLYQGKLAQAASLMEESLGLYRELDHRASIAEVLRDLAWVALQQDQFTDTVGLLKESLCTARDLHDVWILIYCFEGLARAAAALGYAERALTLWGAVEALQENEPMDFPPSERALHERYLAAARTQLHCDECSQAQQQGKFMSTDEAIEFALATEWNSSVPEHAPHT